MEICFIDRMQKIMATSTRISAKNSFKARSTSKIAYKSIKGKF